MAMKCVFLTDSSVSARCSDCGTPRRTDRTLYLICEIIEKDLSAVVNETVYIKERIDRVGVRSQIIKYFIPCAIATFASAFTGPITNKQCVPRYRYRYYSRNSIIDLEIRASIKIIDRASSEG
jgi:ribosomal protein L36